jgi:hypothetical protein
MATKEKLAFLKAHLEEISQNILRQVKEEIVALKKLQPRHPPIRRVGPTTKLCSGGDSSLPQRNLKHRELTQSH